MSNRIFIPELGKAYILAEEATILLYPWNEHPNKDIVQQQFYAHQSKDTFKFKCERKLIPFAGNEDYWTQHGKERMTVVDWYLVSQLQFPESMSELIKSPFDLQKLDSKGTVYLHVETVASWVNRRFHAFAEKKHSVNTYGDYNGVKKNLIVKEIKTFDVNKVEKTNIAAIKAIMLLNPLVKKMINNYIPLEYTYEKGSEFILKDVKSKHPSIKEKVSIITVNGQDISILPEQLNSFVLE